MITQKTIKKTSEKSLSEFEIFIKKYNLEGDISTKRPNATPSNEATYGNCCGTCEHCPLA